MCLENARLIESEKDIVCYKVAYNRGNGLYMTPYLNDIFVLGNSVTKASIKKGNHELITLENEEFEGRIHKNGTMTIRSGAFHSFKNKSDAIDEFYRLKDIKDNIHLFLSDYVTLIECIIPAGSIVFDGEFNDIKAYASNQIIYNRESYVPLKHIIKHFFKK